MSKAQPPHPAMSVSSEALMARYRGGDHAAFRELYRRYSPGVFAYLLRRTGQRAEAEDALQTTFLHLHRARTSYVPGAPLRPWLMAMARNALTDQCRRSYARFEVVSAEEGLPDIAGELSPDESELGRMLGRALSALPTAHAEAIISTNFDGCSSEEAAIVLGTTPGAIKVRVHRGRRQLRAALGCAA